MNTSATPLSSKSTDLMMAIINNPNQNAVGISKVLGVSVSTVTGGLAALKNRGLVAVKDGNLVATEEAEYEYGTPAITTPVTTSAATFPTSFGGAKGVLVETAASEVDSADIDADDDTSESITAHTSDTEITAGSVFIGGVAPKTVKEPVINKTALAKKVYEDNPGMPRAELMKIFMSDPINLSLHGANTYLYNLKKAAGLVKPRSTAETSAEAIVEPSNTDTAE